MVSRAVDAKLRIIVGFEKVYFCPFFGNFARILVILTNLWSCVEGAAEFDCAPKGRGGGMMGGDGNACHSQNPLYGASNTHNNKKKRRQRRPETQ